MAMAMAREGREGREGGSASFCVFDLVLFFWYWLERSVIVFERKRGFGFAALAFGASWRSRRYIDSCISRRWPGEFWHLADIRYHSRTCT
jgi:hypothetical protein